MIAQPILIAGAGGTLGQAFLRGCAARNLRHTGLRRAELDIAEADAVEAACAAYQPWALVNAGGYVRVDAAEREPAACYQGARPGLLCARRARVL